VHGWNSYIVYEHENEEDKTPIVFKENTMSWHHRLGHIGEKGLQALHGKDMVESMFYCIVDFDLCQHFIYGKHNLVRFTLGLHEKSEF